MLPRRVTVSQAGADTIADERTTVMVMLAEQYAYVIGGDPDRDTVDLAVLDTATAGVLAHLVRPADAAGYASVLMGEAPRSRHTSVGA